MSDQFMQDAERLKLAEHVLGGFRNVPCIRALLGEDSDGCECMGCASRAYFAATRPTPTPMAERESRCECVTVFEVHADYCPASPHFSREAKRAMDAAVHEAVEHNARRIATYEGRYGEPAND